MLRLSLDDRCPFPKKVKEVMSDAKEVMSDE
jgi:hypothetical protein